MEKYVTINQRLRAVFPAEAPLDTRFESALERLSTARGYGVRGAPASSGPGFGQSLDPTTPAGKKGPLR